MASLDGGAHLNSQPYSCIYGIVLSPNPDNKMGIRDLI